MVGQTWRMLRAGSLGEFEGALARLQIPMFTVIYADRDGHIMHLFNGQVPKRSGGNWQTWAGIVPGDRSDNLWTEIHEYGDLPRVVDPPTGWLQNANDAPWTTTFPMPLRPDRYPAYMAPPPYLAFRPQRSVRMLEEDPSISFDELVRYKHSTRAEAADHLLEDVIAAARARGTALASRAADVLELWDRNTDASSRGAVLFTEFFADFARQRLPFDQGWRADAPLATPDGLADPAATAGALETAAARVLQRWGTLDVAWGDVYRLREDSLDLPASGGPGGIGVFRVLGFDHAANGQEIATFGDSWVAAVEFGDSVRARALLSYGNASQPGSIHRDDQLPLLAGQRLRPVWRSRAAIEAHLELRERF
jgi:acyl-homoserine-lactone acylase